MRQHEDGQEAGADSFEMPRINMRDYDASGLMDDLSISGTPAFKGRYEDSDLLADDSYEYEMRKAELRGGRDEDDVTQDENYGDQSGGDQTILQESNTPRIPNVNEQGSSTNGGRAGGNAVDAQRDERLRAALFELKKMNEVFENYARALEAARHHNVVSC
jgi:hypothetical protein